MPETEHSKREQLVSSVVSTYQKKKMKKKQQMKLQESVEDHNGTFFFLLTPPNNYCTVYKLILILHYFLKLKTDVSKAKMEVMQLLYSSTKASQPISIEESSSSSSSK